MASSALLSKNSARAAGVLTLSGLMVGGIVLAQGADAAPEVQNTAQATPVASLDAVNTPSNHYVPASLVRPAVAPKSHEQIAAEKKAAAEQKAAEETARREAEAAQKKAEEQAAQQREAEQRRADEQKAAQEKAEQQRQEQAQAAQEQQDDAAAPVVQNASSTTATGSTQRSTGPQTQGSSAPASSSDDAPVASEGSYNRDAVVRAARAQLGRQQDCTALVTNSLRAAGINFHGWPKDYLSLGHTVSASEAKPGDIIYYASNGFGGSHVAIYLGNGRAIHGGWEGGTTAEFSAYLPAASAPVFIHVDR